MKKPRGSRGYLFVCQGKQEAKQTRFLGQDKFIIFGFSG
jgi:hypothetical protein